MAHEVTLSLADKIVLHKDVEIEISTDDGKLGTLLVSKGNIEWRPKNKSKTKYRLAWSRFAKVMEANGNVPK